MKFATPYSNKKKVVIKFDGPGRTRQSSKDECDINFILKKYNVTEAHLHANRHSGQYGFATSETLHEALNTVTTATSMFEELPAKIRDRFNGSPGEFLDFTANPANKAEMAELGLITKVLTRKEIDDHNGAQPPSEPPEPTPEPAPSPEPIA